MSRIATVCAGTGICFVDQPSHTEGLVLPVHGSLTVSGWAAIEDARDGESILVEVVSGSMNTVHAIPATREDRPDVASHLRNTGLVASGFHATIPVTSEMFGRYSVFVVQTLQDRHYRSQPLITFDVEVQQYETLARRGIASKFLAGCGIEIGALQRPLAVPHFCHVTYVDRMSYRELTEHYPELCGLPIKDPDVIDDGEKLSKFAAGSQDFVIANHLLEHCRDPITTISSFLRVLKPGGILYMAVPDKRYTFDVSRPVTTYDDLRAAFVAGSRRGVADLYKEWAVHVLCLDGPIASEVARDLEAREYSIHYNVWTLSDLISFLITAQAEFDMPFSLWSVVAAENEVITILRRH